jgi:hypothetical protein
MGTKRLLAVGAATLAVAALATGVARGLTGGGKIPEVAYKTGGSVSTPSSSFITVASRTFAAGPGPVLVRFSAQGSVRDFNSGGVFVGKSYAAMLVRVVIGTDRVMSPGPVSFFDNTGKITIARPRPMSNSFEWAGELGGTSALKTVKVQVANLNTWDMASISSWTLVVQHN